MGTGESNGGGNPVMDPASHPRGSRNTPSFMLQKPEISARLMGLLARKANHEKGSEQDKK